MKNHFSLQAEQRTLWSVALILAAANLFFRAMAPNLGPWWLRLVGEAALFLSLAAWSWAGSGYFASYKDRPLSIVLRVAFLGTLILVLFLAWSGRMFQPADPGDAGAVIVFGAGLFLVLLTAGLGLVIPGLRELFFLKKMRQPGWYFKAMLAFFTLTYFAPVIWAAAVPFFMSMSICLLLLNSFRVKWIAFLVKKQKKTLIALTALALGIFLTNSILVFNSHAIARAVAGLSAGIFQLGKLILLYGTTYAGVILIATLFHLPTAEAYDRKAEEFASLVDLSQSITGAMEFKELAEKVTSVTAGVCHGDFSWLLIKETNDFSVPAAFNISVREARELSLALLGEIVPDSRAVKVFRDKKLKIRIQNDALNFSFSALAIAPLRVKNRATGYLFLAIKKDSVFEEDDIRTVEAFANSAAMALENARMLETRLEKERLLKELEVARVIQRRMLPESPPKTCCADIAVYFAPAYEVGGDYFDFFPLDDRRLGFVIADVSGKGLAAAFIMAELKGVFESLSGVISDPGRLLAKANGVLRKSLEKNRFVSASYGLLDPQAMTLRVARAGHMPFFVSSKGRIETYRPPGLVLGAADEPLFSDKLEEITIGLNAGDTIVFITDGISEAKNLVNSEFGYERLQSVIQANGDGNAGTLADSIMAEVKAFANQPVQYDDITLLVIKMN
ncbi:MAG TPA: GAF domain-containing SpoIIE family protein phosphatase [Candidatus Binatia bacterium]|nr:GAF domain-containing SpoIIE family protein phosphatase [Candidatus Binatia bacterium]